MPIERLFETAIHPPVPEDLYTTLDLPEPPADRPYVYINMVSTADGKIVLGEVGGSAMGVGGKTDQLLFRRLQKTCDAAMIGGSTLRASQVIYPPEIARFVVTRGGDVPLDNRFFRDAPDKAFVIAPEDLPAEQTAKIQATAQLVQAGQSGVDLREALRILRQERGIRYLLCEGGATLNDDLIRHGLADELFLTLTNKLKGGSHLPTPVDGQGFPPNAYLPLTLLSVYHDEGELYLRYKLASTPVKK
jgi:riboflavin biosynthesis pyrimidine reductase